MRRSKRIAWISLLATLFGAVSPAFAAFILAERPAALRQMLGLPGVEQVAFEADDCSEHIHHHAAIESKNDSGADHDGSRHASHGIYCSFCLNPGSVAGIAPAPVSISILSLAFDISVPAAKAGYLSGFVPLYRSRAPPANF
jgi:hypothetical protein